MMMLVKLVASFAGKYLKKYWLLILLLVVVGIQHLTIKNQEHSIELMESTISLKQAKYELLESHISNQNEAVQQLRQLGKEMQDRVTDASREIQNIRQNVPVKVEKIYLSPPKNTCEESIEWLVEFAKESSAQ